MTAEERAVKIAAAIALLDELDSILADLASEPDYDMCGDLRDHINELA